MKSLFPVLVLTSLLCSCASIITGSTDDILVTSHPAGASFRTSLGTRGTTPQTITVPDDEDISITISEDGYEEYNTFVGTRYSWWIVGNAVLGGIIGLVVDVAAYGHVHDSDHVHVDLSPMRPGQGSAALSGSTDRPRESFTDRDSRQR